MFGHIPKEESSRQKVVLITGASKGIGLASAERFAEKGYLVYATARDPDNAKDLQELAKKYSQNILVQKLDVTDSEKNIFNIIGKMQPIDILINNAGIGLYGPVETATDEQEKLVFETNVFGLLRVTKAVLGDLDAGGNGMRKRGVGRIITLSSIVGPLPDPYQPTYSASKAAVESYMAVLRKNMADEGLDIIVTNVNPGPVLTPFEASTPNGIRFAVGENPYKTMQSGRDKWNHIMREGGRPVSETVDTIFKVATHPNPNYWNPTEKPVEEQFARVYKDTTGNTYMAGIVVNKPQNQLEKTMENIQK